MHRARQALTVTRSLLRLVDSENDELDHLIRDAARSLGGARDAHVATETAEGLLDRASSEKQRRRMERAALALRDAASAVAEETPDPVPTLDDTREARAIVSAKLVASDEAAVAEGIAMSYGEARRRMKRAIKKPSSKRLHAWRKSTRHLRNQLRALPNAKANKQLKRVTRLTDCLGELQDLDVLERALDGLSDAPKKGSSALRDVSAARRAKLRQRALKLGTKVFDEKSRKFGKHALAPVEKPAAAASRVGIEIERRFLVERFPRDVRTTAEIQIRQAYVASDPLGVHVRIREADGTRTLTTKADRETLGERSEIETPVSRKVFDGLWILAGTRTIEKRRSIVKWRRRVIEVDVFRGPLDGLVIAEVEFDSREEAQAFEPPAWFGAEITDDPRYRNASLAAQGLPGAVAS